MTGVRHFTASAIVLDDHGTGRGGGREMLLVHHNKFSKTGLHTQIIADPLFTHPAVTTHVPPADLGMLDTPDGHLWMVTARQAE